jgi:hypothetical protein
VSPLFFLAFFKLAAKRFKNFLFLTVCTVKSAALET